MLSSVLMDNFVGDEGKNCYGIKKVPFKLWYKVKTWNQLQKILFKKVIWKRSKMSEECSTDPSILRTPRALAVLGSKEEDGGEFR